MVIGETAVQPHLLFCLAIGYLPLVMRCGTFPLAQEILSSVIFHWACAAPYAALIVSLTI